MWRGSSERKTAFGEGRERSAARRGVLVTGRVGRSYQEQRDGTVSKNFVWPDAR